MLRHEIELISPTITVLMGTIISGLQSPTTLHPTSLPSTLPQVREYCAEQGEERGRGGEGEWSVSPVECGY